MLPRKNFGKFTYCSGHFSTFGTIFRQILFNFFLPLNLSFSPNMMHFDMYFTAGSVHYFDFSSLISAVC